MGDKDCLVRRDILELKGVVKPQGTGPVLVTLRGPYVVSLAGTTTSPSLVLSRYKPLQVPIQNTAFGCKISTAFFTAIVGPPGSPPPPPEHVIKPTFNFCPASSDIQQAIKGFLYILYFSLWKKRKKMVSACANNAKKYSGWWNFIVLKL